MLSHTKGQDGFMFTGFNGQVAQYTKSLCASNAYSHQYVNSSSMCSGGHPTCFRHGTQRATDTSTVLKHAALVRAPVSRVVTSYHV